MKFIFLIITACLITGCQTPVTERKWVQPGKTDADAAQAIKECKFEALKLTNPNPLIEAYDRVELFKACMAAKGYTEAK